MSGPRIISFLDMLLILAFFMLIGIALSCSSTMETSTSSSPRDVKPYFSAELTLKRRPSNDEIPRVLLPSQLPNPEGKPPPVFDLVPGEDAQVLLVIYVPQQNDPNAEVLLSLAGKQDWTQDYMIVGASIGGERSKEGEWRRVAAPVDRYSLDEWAKSIEQSLREVTDLNVRWRGMEKQGDTPR